MEGFCAFAWGAAKGMFVGGEGRAGDCSLSLPLFSLSHLRGSVVKSAVFARLACLAAQELARGSGTRLPCGTEGERVSDTVERGRTSLMEKMTSMASSCRPSDHTVPKMLVSSGSLRASDIQPKPTAMPVELLGPPRCSWGRSGRCGMREGSGVNSRDSKGSKT